ncbi:MAG TPA: PAS-domain containing protein [Ideonella sp.]|uniref:PAS-domain containing protein n=1 Tax=Ideonella sp. TaxID=1929293 RepID=UPI002E31D1D0|nr:PAS-domain containing protein [Ideonella sp.]HEX5685913.1 PAS-domain containing protein [Ideonella sp.]
MHESPQDNAEDNASKPAFDHRTVLDSMFETMEEGVSVFDADLRLVTVNRRFRELLSFPDALYVPGTPFEAFVRFNVERGDYGAGDVEQQVRERVEIARKFEAHQFERERPDGTILEVRGRPLPGGGFVTIYADITQRARAERALRQANLLLEKTFETMDQGISIADKDLTMLGMNRRFRELLDFPESLCQRGTPFEAFIRYNAKRGDYGQGLVEDQVRTRVAIASKFEPHCFERERPDGTVLEIRGMPMREGGFVTIYTDVTQRAQAERAMRDSEARFRSLTELSSDWFWEQAPDHRFTRLEGRHAAGDNTAFDAELGKTWWELGYEIEEGWEAHHQVLAEQKPFRDVVMRRTPPDGPATYVRVSGTPILARDGSLAGYRGVGRDITQQRGAEERIRYLATHDDLTGLPNRVWFSELLQLAIQRAGRHGRQFAVLFIDLDQFKSINDTLGHGVGDELLRAVAQRLKSCLRSADVVARLGGDEFVVLLQDLHGSDDAAAVARKILSAVVEPVQVHGLHCRVTASIGICLFPDDAQDEHTLMKNADIAMYSAKDQGKNNFQFHSRAVTAQSLERMAMELHLRNALPRQELALHYQAKVDLNTNQITGVEALLRWNSPELGPVGPSRFIPVAEQSGLIVPIGQWVMRQACAQNMAWQRQGFARIGVSVNLSARQFMHEGLLDDITDALRSADMDPSLLELEITEGMVMHDIERVVQLLQAIKRMGVRIAIDDFGTGYSSLAHLKRFPVDVIKIDRSFIRDITTDPADRTITEAIIAMGKTLNLTVVAEGVETAEQRDVLRGIACDEIQGYYFSRPVPPEQVASLLRHQPVSAVEASPISTAGSDRAAVKA